MYGWLDRLGKGIGVVGGNREGYYEMEEFFDIGKLEKGGEIGGWVVKVL